MPKFLQPRSLELRNVDDQRPRLRLHGDLFHDVKNKYIFPRRINAPYSGGQARNEKQFTLNIFRCFLLSHALHGIQTAKRRFYSIKVS